MSRRGVPGFRGERLEKVLAARRLSQVQLASMIGVSTGTVSKWRSDQQSPEPDALDRLAAVTNVASDWFLRPVPAVEHGATLFRSNASALKSARTLLGERCAWAKEMALILQESVELPPLALPSRTFTDAGQITTADIEDAAAEFRALGKLGLGPISDLLLAIESAGAVVVREETGVAQIEGLSNWCGVSGRPFVFLSADKDNCFRSRFDAAHELGHLILHRHVPKDVVQKQHNEIERQAHRFAGALLMPAESFALEVPTVPTLDTLLTLKPRWRVSVAAMIKRMEALGLLDATQLVNLFRRRSIRWGARAEPLDDRFEPEQPRVLRRAVQAIVDGGIVPRAAVPNYLGFAERDVEMLMGLPDGFFRQPTAVPDSIQVGIRRHLSVVK